MCPAMKVVLPKLGSCARVTRHLGCDATEPWLLVKFFAKSANLQTGSDRQGIFNWQCQSACVCALNPHQCLRHVNCGPSRSLVAIVSLNAKDSRAAPAFNLFGKIGTLEVCNSSILYMQGW